MQKERNPGNMGYFQYMVIFIIFYDDMEMNLEYFLPVFFQYMGVSKNMGVSPQIIHLFIGFSLIFTIHFGVPLVLETPIWNPRTVKQSQESDHHCWCEELGRRPGEFLPNR